MAKKGVFIDREKIVELIRDIGCKHWTDFTASDLTPVGAAQRCVMAADGKTAAIDLFFNNDGTTTITPTGKNTEISSQIKVLLEEQCEFSSTALGKTYAIKKLSDEWAEKLIGYLTSLEEVSVEEYVLVTIPVHRKYIFTSKIGDRLTINIYETGTLTLQGKPAYLYGEAISFLSYCRDISVDDIVDSINSFHNIDIKTSEVRNDMEMLMPRAYGHLDEMILKLLSPSVSLRKVNLELEDYSCYAFPALKALEGYIKYLFGLKNIEIGHNFGGIFNQGTLSPDIAAKIGDDVFQKELETLYEYLTKTRHVKFHAEQKLAATALTEDKHEADDIVNSVINLIESSYVTLFQ